MDKGRSLKRWHPLIGEWVIIAPVTSDRPWNGLATHRQINIAPEYDPACYLCPGVKRASGEVNPRYKNTFAFDNDFSSLSTNRSMKGEKLHTTDIPVDGICRVVCFSPQHNTTLAEMNKAGLIKVISTLQNEYLQLSSTPGIENVLIFENKGEIVGVSNLHPHGQIYATDFVPRVLLLEYDHAKKHIKRKDTCLFCDILADELQSLERVVCQNANFIAYVPYFARHAYEVHIISRRHVPAMTAFNSDEVNSLASIYQEVLVRYDNLFEMPFPNITILHNAPCAKRLSPEPFHFHIEFCPPLRSADKMKYMAGFETGGGNIINPMQPEESAEILRSLSLVHYTGRSN
jgi:UDPglucose--hexose-1-phosphate uridylyltransferase